MTAKNNKPEQYALALLAIARANVVMESITSDLQYLIEFIRAHASVRRFLANDDLTALGKQHALSELLDGHIHPLLVQFTLLLANAGDVDLLSDIATAYAVASMDQKTAVGEVQSAVPLSAERIAAMEEEISLQLGGTVSLQPRVMTNILGGIRVKVGNIVIDGTLDTQLEEARRLLVATV